MNTSAAKSCIFIGIYSLSFSLFLVYLRRVLYYLLLLLSILPHKQLKLLLYISKIVANGNRYFWRCMMRHTKRRQVPKNLFQLWGLFSLMFVTAVCVRFLIKARWPFLQRSGFSKTQSTLLCFDKQRQQQIESGCDPGLVSRKSLNFTGHFRVSKCLLYLKNREDLSRQTLQTCFF